MLKRLRKNHPLGYCVGAEVLFLGSLILTSILVVFLLMLFRFDLAYADDYLLGCIQELVGVGVAVLLLAYLMPSLRSMFTAGSAIALALFTALSAVLCVVAGLRSKSFTLGCLSFASCCVALTALFLLQSSWLTEGFSAVLSALCLFTPFEEFVNSSFSIPTLVYYGTITVLFLFFTAQGLEKRRWN